MIIFRADGNSTIGLGHIMRCLSIADAAAASGEACLFVTADEDSARFVMERGCKAISLDGNYLQLDSEILQIKRLLASEKPKALVVDSYYVTDHYLSELHTVCRESFCKLAYLDDVLAFPYVCDLLINYNFSAKREEYLRLYAKAAALPGLLLGTQYVPLRKEFQNHPFPTVSGTIHNVFFSTGGADPEHVALRYLRHLEAAKAMERFHFHLPLGKMNADAPKIRLLAQSLTNVTLHENVSEMYALMSRCDAAISASGSMLYELCASSVPIISYVVADNQLENARALREVGAVLYAGDIRENLDFPKEFDRLLDELNGSGDKRLDMAQTAYAMVDGMGAGRIAAALSS